MRFMACAYYPPYGGLTPCVTARMSGPLLAGGGKCNEEVPAVGALGVFLRAASQELQYLA